ncbi:MAG TPA: glucose-1-phosphate adenylyltransferase [Anaerovoracaceae bacterium]|nr:glucose-1-phosphate adenylyltransferase [Anaerovoracaceae bacterium]
MNNKKILAMLLAGGQGSRLGYLTKDVAKPAVSFGGKYRMIDFSLSNCANSGIDTVGVLTQYRPHLLYSYLGNGAAWDLDYSNGGLHILPPYYTEEGGNWYNGTADAIYSNLDFLDRFNPKLVIILSGDHLYKMDYRKFISFHERKNADVTISTITVPIEEACRFGILTTDSNYKLINFEEKPNDPKSNIASMGIYLFDYSVLKEALQKDHENINSNKDFGKNVIPSLLNSGHNLYAYVFQDYWQDCGTIESYYNSQMGLLKDVPDFDIFDKRFKIYSNTNISPPHHISKKGNAKQSLISNGAYIGGEVYNSVISNDAYIGDNATIKNSLVLPRAKVLDNSYINYSIVCEKAIVAKNSYIEGSIENIKLISS